MRRIMLALAVSALMGSVLAVPVSATPDQHRPFVGFGSGEITYQFVDTSVCPSGLQQKSSVAGIATHMGSVISTDDSFQCAGTTGPSPLTVVAANGDAVYMLYQDTSMTTVGDDIIVGGAWTIVGGTGRFAGASGYAEGVTHVQFMGYEEFVWPITSYQLSGWISY